MLYLTEPGAKITSAGFIFTGRKHFQLTVIIILGRPLYCPPEMTTITKRQDSHSYSKQYYNQKRLLSLAPESYYLKTFRMLCLF